MCLTSNGQQHSENFNNTLIHALRFVKAHAPSKYNEAGEKYATSRIKVTHRVARRGKDENSDDSSPPKKRGKTEDVDKYYMELFYRFFLRKRGKCE